MSEEARKKLLNKRSTGNATKMGTRQRDSLLWETMNGWVYAGFDTTYNKLESI